MSPLLIGNPSPLHNSSIHSGRSRAKLGARRIATARNFSSAVLLALLLAALPAYSFTAIYVFGDSLSDTGRNPAPASYSNGRFSNGPLWVEYLSTNLGLPYNSTNNFAVAGSATSDLLSQVASLPASSNLQSALFTIESGANDFVANTSLGSNDAAWSVMISNTVANLTNAVGLLYANGAREMLVGNLLNLGQTPLFNTLPADEIVYGDSKVAEFNTELASAMTNLMQHRTGLRIYLADLNRQLSNVVSAPAVYGFTVSTIGALQDTNLTDKSFTGPGANYIFWDPAHPTTKEHALFAALAFQLVGVQLNVARAGTNLNLQVSNLYPGLPYTIQSSPNLATWTIYQTFTATNTNAAVVLTNAPGTRSFYRVEY